jgi:spermidine synthase
MRTALRAAAAVAALFLASSALAQETPAGAGEVLYEQLSPFERVFVVETGSVRFLRFGNPNGDDQTGIDLRHPDVPQLEYIPLTLGGMALAGGRQRGMVIGFGGGAVTRYWHGLAPEMTIDSVEIDPVVAAVAFSYFGFQYSPLLPIHLMDGRQWVQETPHHYDVVLLDAYGHGDAPYHLTTLEFYQDVQDRLAPGGVVMANMVAESGRTLLSMMRTFDEAFPVVLRLDTPNDGNIVLLGSMSKKIDAEAFDRRLAAYSAELGLDEPLELAPVPMPDSLLHGVVLRDADAPR